MGRRFRAAAALALLALATAPAATQQARAISASDKAAGAKAHPQLLAQFGGAYRGAAADYVAGVGKRIAVQSGLSNSQSDFTVTLLDSPVENAFALPGGYIYITRGLLALMNDEAELASVLGHEVGHVAARHSARRDTTSTIGQILSTGLGVLTGSDMLGRVAGYGAQLYTLRFSRSQEYQADDLGIRYLAGARYDPFAAADMLALLNAEAALAARIAGKEQDDVPTWGSTHPNTADRVARARDKAAVLAPEPNRAGRNRDTLLAAIDGMIYDDDVAQGVVDGQTFRHPKLKLAFAAPAGYALANGAEAVTVTGPGGTAQFGGGRSSGDLAAYAQQVFRDVGVTSGIDAAALRPTTVNGIEAVRGLVRVGTSRGQVDVGVVAYRLASGGSYHFVTLTPAGDGFGPFAGMTQSLAPLSDGEAAAIRPRRLRVVTVAAGDSVAALSERMAYRDFRVERFRTLNALSEGVALRPGDKVKIVVRG